MLLFILNDGLFVCYVQRIYDINNKHRLMLFNYVRISLLVEVKTHVTPNKLNFQFEQSFQLIIRLSRVEINIKIINEQCQLFSLAFSHHTVLLNLVIYLNLLYYLIKSLIMGV